MKKFWVVVLLFAMIFTLAPFFQEVYSKEYVGLVLDFWAEWCGPCHLLDPHMDAWRAQYGDIIKFTKIDVDDPLNLHLVERYDVTAIPRVIVLDSLGNVVADVTGFSDENVSTIEAALILLAAQVGEHPPLVTIDKPLPESKTGDEYLTIEGTVGDKIDALSSLTIILNSSKSFSLPPQMGHFSYTLGPLSEGLNTVTVEAVDEAGYVGRASVSFYKEATISFSDIPAQYFAEEAIKELVSRGIISGYEDGTFRPSNPVTREEFTKIIVKALNLSLVKPSGPSFQDVAPDRWSYQFIETAKSLNLMIGFPDNTFRPQTHLTNAQILTVICRQKGFIFSSTGQPSFADLPPQHWAFGYIETLKAKGFPLDCLISANKVFPDNDATRARVCVFVYEMIK